MLPSQRAAWRCVFWRAWVTEFGLLQGHLKLIAILICMCALAVTGCTLSGGRGGLPSAQTVTRGQLVIHSDFHLPRKHRLLDELVSRRVDLSDELDLPLSDEPIDVYLFEDKDHFQTFMIHSHPEFPNRRAFFVKSDTSLKVFAFWGARVGEDLRHEVTHGYVHSVVPNIPLWLDEGLAEYFEVARGKGGVNGPHVYHLANRLRNGKWKPDLERLESLVSARELTQMDYAESWLWVHFLLTGDQQTKSIVKRQLNSLRENGEAGLFLPIIEAEVPDYETQLLMHLRVLSE